MAASMLAILLPVILTIFAVAVIVWGVRRNRTISFDTDRYPGLLAVRRSTLTARYVGLAIGIVALVVVASLGPFWRGLFLAPSAAGAVLIFAILIGQQLAYDGARTTGVAGVERRRIRDYLPRRLSVAVLLFLVVLVVTATWATAAASPDDLGHYRAFAVTGTRTIMTETGPEVATVESTRTPFPGGFYTAMLAIGLPIVLLLGMIGLWLTARRPRNGADPELVPADDALRRQTAEGIVAAAGLAVSVSLLGVAFGAALAVGGMAEYGFFYTLTAVALGLMALGSLAVASWCTVLILVPGGGTTKLS